METRILIPEQLQILVTRKNTYKKLPDPFLTVPVITTNDKRRRSSSSSNVSPTLVSSLNVDSKRIKIYKQPMTSNSDNDDNDDNDQVAQVFVRNSSRRKCTRQKRRPQKIKQMPSSPSASDLTELNSSSKSESEQDEVDGQTFKEEDENERELCANIRTNIRVHKLRTLDPKHERLSHNHQKNSDKVVKICAREDITKGTQISPSDGQINVLMLDGLMTTMILEDDVRFMFGCFDRLMDDPTKPSGGGCGGTDEKIRLCSWLKFVTTSTNLDSNVNLVAKFMDRKPVLEFSQDLVAGEEVVAYFDVESATQCRRRRSSLDSFEYGHCIGIKSETVTHNMTNAFHESMCSREGPLDLSNCKSPNSSHKSFSPHSSTSMKASCTTAVKVEPGNCRRSSSPASSTSSSSATSTASPTTLRSGGRKGSSTKKSLAGSSRKPGNIFSIRNVLQLQSQQQQQQSSSSSSTSAFFQPHLFSSAASNSHSHPEQLMLTPPLSSSTTNATATTALSSPTTDSNHSLLSSPGSTSTPKLSPYDSHHHHHHHNIPVVGKNKFTHANHLHMLTAHYGFNAATGMGPGASSASGMARLGATGSTTTTSTSSLLRPILRTRGRERSLLPCEVCHKAFDRPSLLKRHMRTHTGEKPHVCDTCGKGFSTSSSLNTHRRIHSGEKPHQCPICGKRFTASSNLYYHRMTHNKEKPHKCLLCGKSFPTPGDLKSHQYVHSGSWPFSCRICNRGFSKQTNLRNHLLLHSGDKPHSCRICNKKFALACNLRAHLRTHEEDSLSTCLSCKRSFVNSMNMVINGQCRVCASSGCGGGGSSSSSGHHIDVKLQGSLLPVSSSRSIGMTDGKLSPLGKFHSTGTTLTSNITIPQPATTTHQSSTSAMPSLPRKSSKSPESNRKEPHRKMHSSFHGFGAHGLPPLHGIQHPYHPLHHLHQSPSSSSSVSSASTSLAAIATGHQFPHPLLNNVHQQHFPFPAAAAAADRSNPFLEQLFEWNLRVAKETVGNLGLMQQKLLESQMLAAHLMSNPNGLSDLLRLQVNANNAGNANVVGGVGRGGGIPAAAAAILGSSGTHHFGNVTSSGIGLGPLDEKK